MFERFRKRFYIKYNRQNKIITEKINRTDALAKKGYTHRFPKPINITYIDDLVETSSDSIESAFKNGYVVIEKLELDSIDDKRVYIVEYNNTKYILKMKKQLLDGELETHKILAGLNHHNVQQVYLSYRSMGYYCFVYEYVEGYDLYEYFICLHSLAKEEVIKTIIKQVANGLKFLQCHDIIHGDIKYENIVFDPLTNIAKIIDFDLCIHIGNKSKYISNVVFGTLNYVAPESYTSLEYSNKTDVWQLGTILYLLITEEYPCTQKCIRACYKKCHEEMKKTVYRIIKRRNFDQSVYTLVSGMLSYRSTRRYNINQILRCKWINM
jgi:serine/threonine protein kinase